MLIRGVIRHEIQDYPDAELMGGSNQRVHLGKITEDRMNVGVVGDIVSVIRHR